VPICFVLLKTPRVTQQSVNGHGMSTNDLHVMSASRCVLRSKCLKLFKGVSAVVSVVESDCGSGLIRFLKI
jgi:hypothetical protein